MFGVSIMLIYTFMFVPITLLCKSIFCKEYACLLFMFVLNNVLRIWAFPLFTSPTYRYIINLFISWLIDALISCLYRWLLCLSIWLICVYLYIFPHLCMHQFINACTCPFFFFFLLIQQHICYLYFVHPQISLFINLLICAFLTVHLLTYV